MRNIILILTCLFLASCYTSKQCREKFCSKDTVQVQFNIHDTVIVDSSHVDTVFNSITDTITIQNDRLVIRYIKVKDSVYLSGTAKADTIIRELVVYRDVILDCPQPTLWELLQTYWYLLLISFLIGLFCFVWIKR